MWEIFTQVQDEIAAELDRALELLWQAIELQLVDKQQSIKIARDAEHVFLFNGAPHHKHITDKRIS